MIKIDRQLLDATSQRARESSRGRMNHNFHSGPADTLQRMLNAMEPGTYIQPHKHEAPDKREVFFALSGTLCIVEFWDDGRIKDFALLKAGSECSGAEIPARTFHTVISLQSGSVAYEIKDGPYIPIEDKNFAAWAPAENSPQAGAWLKQLIEKLNLSII
ncbi:MAG: WbuC family cupin fold metalloprotein [Lentimicrobiaceae bacterium]|nr:WbuC family cupin fold metalloprotein [Lentimicrobiaceae bacterium]